MNKLLFKAVSSLRFARRFPIAQPSVRFFATQSQTESNMAQIVNNFYARGESEELTVASIAKTMGEILKTHMTIDDHRDYNPISDELAFYVVKLLRQHKKPFVSHQ